VSDGLFFDLGGGSLQISRFAGRRLGPGWSLPLGALRLSHRFLQDDPPAGSELRRLLRHVRNQLAKARVPALPAGGELVGTGGTLRNLAKVDRAARDYPIERLHGYVLARDRVAAIVRVLARQPLARRDRIAGLSDERGDSIVGGALAIEALMDHVGARHIRVSGQGSREGIVHALLRDSLPSPAVVRQASLASFARRFATFDAATAERRRALAAVLARQLLRRAPRDLREALEHAALLLDVGRSMDFFDRHEHVASIVVATELNGFSHRDIALVAAITLAAREQQRADFRTLLGAEDREDVARAGLLLALADDVIERCRPGPRVRARCHRTASAFHLTVPGLLAWRPRNIGPRFERLFGRELVVRPGGVGGARQRAGAGPAAARPRTRV
jgi:exopolyphosphatase/guanosine-5'-triphosphate,3'-diphosphate pyrophosphatase